MPPPRAISPGCELQLSLRRSAKSDLVRRRPAGASWPSLPRLVVSRSRSLGVHLTTRDSGYFSHSPAPLTTSPPPPGSPSDSSIARRPPAPSPALRALRVSHLSPPPPAGPLLPPQITPAPPTIPPSAPCPSAPCPPLPQPPTPPPMRSARHN